jgi:hypothetical protein
VLALKWITRITLALFVAAASLAGLALLAFAIFYIAEEPTPIETRLAQERQRFIEYQKTPDKFQYIGQTGVVLRIPASYFMYDYAPISTNPCFHDRICAAGKPVKQTYFSFVWPSGGEQDYETAYKPLHPDRVRVVLSGDYDDGNCRPGGWVRSCQGDPAGVLAKWTHFGYVRPDKSGETLYGLMCHSAERVGTVEWLCFGDRAGTRVILTITLTNDSGWPPNPGTSISYEYPVARDPIYVSIHVNSKHAADWPEIVDRSRVLISQWTVPH